MDYNFVRIHKTLRARGLGGFGRGIAKSDPDVLQCRCATRILGCVMQRANCLIFVAAVFDNQSRHGHQMQDVRDGRALPRLSAMQPVGVVECVIKAIREHLVELFSNLRLRKVCNPASRASQNSDDGEGVIALAANPHAPGERSTFIAAPTLKDLDVHRAS